MNPFKDSEIKQIKFMASVLIQTYYNDCDNCGCGGSLHIVLDDKNTSKEDVDFCINYANENGDLIGYEIGIMLYKLSQSDLEDVVYNWSMIANGVEDYE